MPGLLHSILYNLQFLTLKILKAKGPHDLVTLLNRKGKYHRQESAQITIVSNPFQSWNQNNSLIFENYSSILGREMGWENRGILLSFGKRMWTCVVSVKICPCNCSGGKKKIKERGKQADLVIIWEIHVFIYSSSNLILLNKKTNVETSVDLCDFLFIIVNKMTLFPISSLVLVWSAVTSPTHISFLLLQANIWFWKSGILTPGFNKEH